MLHSPAFSGDEPMFTFVKLAGFWVLSAMLLLLGACQSSAAPTQGSQPVAAVQTDLGSYGLGTGDKIRITVFGEPQLSGEFEIDGTGAISMPLIGQLKAVGLNTPQLERKITEMLDGDYILNPRVSAEVINYRPFYILGEVTKPGQYPYTNGLTVLNAVAASGGFKYRANQKKVFIKHVDSPVETVYDLTSTTIVKPGDTLRIGERIF
jgi:protein involved in polysaccharide export with SLBB domain